MRKKEWTKIYSIITIIVATILVVSFCVKDTSVSIDGVADQVHFIVLPDKQPSNAILIESNGHFGLIDASNPSNCDYEEFNFQKGNGTSVADYLKSAGVEHLDFVVATHSHSDHIGGIPELANSVNGKGESYINENTAYIYKEYKKTKKDEIESSDEESLEEEYVAEAGWQNAEFAEKAALAMRERKAIFLDSSKPKNEEWTKFGAQYFNSDNASNSTITFGFGNGTIKLFNLFHISDHSENANSIVLLFSCKGRTVLITGDLDLYDNAEESVMDAVSSDSPERIDVLQAGHHGFHKSTSIETLKKIRPRNVVLMNANGTEDSEWPSTSFAPFLSSTGGKIYGTLWGNKSIIYDLSNDEILTYSNKKKLKEPTPWEGNPQGWYKWYYDSDEYHWVYQDSHNNYYTGKRTIKGRLYEFDEDGLLLGWHGADGRYGFTDIDGREQDGWQELCGEKYFFENGITKTGWQELDGKKFYFDHHGCMQKGWIKVKGNWYMLDEHSGECIRNQFYDEHYLKDDGSMATNEWIGEYYYGEDGVMVKNKKRN